MALRSQVQFHNFWGASFTDDNNLPNNPGNPLAVLNLEEGDFAYVAEGASKTFWVCTDPGTVNGGDATWVQLSTGSPTTDRFAPKYLIGGSSDTAAALTNIDGFTYIPYTGWQAALAAVWSGAPGDVHVRPGTFGLSGPLTILAGCSLRGAGQTTIFTTTDTGNGTLGAFSLQAGATLSDCKIVATSGATGADSTTFAIVDTFAASAAAVYVENVVGSYEREVESTATCLGFYRVASYINGKFSDCDVTLLGTLTPALPEDSLCGWLVVNSALNALSLTSCSHSGGDAAVVHIGASLSISQLSAEGTSSVGVGVYGELPSVANIVNSNISALDGYAVQVGNLACVAGLSNNYLKTIANTLPAVESVGSGRMVGNSMIATASVAPLDTSTGQGHVIGFNVFSYAVTTAATDEVAHNI